ncbi:hypothetical protein [Iningainema tapete]|uniref:Uncharacterized protein n=1 Tax=Iningainema tapete BLCC-T55 TaxID=2748662 RepID=A0A8J6XP98_9CYAN|nr:hypothetical protein [Iningainema tapete]MBD2776756.1 hypothetical protein [Iningainema tapete BLCC-T55]
MSGRGKEATQYKSTGLGIGSGRKSYAFKIAQKYDHVLENLPNKSEKFREWIIQGMLREGLIEDNEYDNSY